MKQRVAMLVHPDDNVLCAIENIEQGEQAYVALANEGVTANEFIKQGHKIARREIKKGDPVVKYGTTVGLAKCDIHKGDWVHDHNELLASFLVNYSDDIASEMTKHFLSL